MEEYSPDFAETLKIVGGTTVWGAAVKIFLATADEDLAALCLTNQFFAEVCRNNDAWKAKFRQKYRDLMDGVAVLVGPNEYNDYRQLYLNEVFGLANVFPHRGMALIIDDDFEVMAKDVALEIKLPGWIEDEQVDEIERLITANGLTVYSDEIFEPEGFIEDVEVGDTYRMIAVSGDGGQMKELRQLGIDVVRYLKSISRNR